MSCQSGSTLPGAAIELALLAIVAIYMGLFLREGKIQLKPGAQISRIMPRAEGLKRVEDGVVL